MQNLLNPKFSACTAQDPRQSDLGEKFKALSADEQRRHAMRVIEKADELGRRKTLRLSVLIDRNNPPDLEHHRVKKTIWSVAFSDRERAISWIIQAYGFGLGVFANNSMSGLGHPCEGRL